MNATSPKTRSKLRWRIARGAIVALVFLATAVFLVIAIENFRGRRAWAGHTAMLAGKGETVEVSALIPKVPPADQNFAATPFLAVLLDYTWDPAQNAMKWRDSNAVQRAQSDLNLRAGNNGAKPPSQKSGDWHAGRLTELAGWQTFFVGNTNFPQPEKKGTPAEDVLVGLRKFDPILEELRQASQRPSAVFPLHYDESIAMLLPHLAVLRNVANVLNLRACALIAAGRTTDALPDIKLILHLADSIKSEPLLISHLVRLALLETAVQPVWEGWKRRAWNADQLRDLQETLAKVQVVASLPDVYRGERAFMIDTLRRIQRGHLRGNLAQLGTDSNPPMDGARLMPSGFYHQNYVTLSTAIQSKIDQIVPKTGVIQFKPDEPEISHYVNSRFFLYRIFAQLLLPATGRVGAKTAHAQASLRMGELALALERYRLAKGAYPDQLQDLIPDFVPTMPEDPANGGPLRYTLHKEGGFLLYSIGSDGKDEGGRAVTEGKSGTPKIVEGDWVWPVAANNHGPSKSDLASP